MNLKLPLLLVLCALCALSGRAEALQGDIKGPAFDQLQNAADEGGDGARSFDHARDRGDGDSDGFWGHGGRRDHDRDHDDDSGRGERRRRRSRVEEPPAPSHSPSLGKRVSSAIMGDTDKGRMVGSVMVGGSLLGMAGMVGGPIGVLAGIAIGAAIGFLFARFL